MEKGVKSQAILKLFLIWNLKCSPKSVKMEIVIWNFVAKTVELRDFFITLLDQVNSTLTPTDMGHFRAQPTYSS